VKMKSIVLFIFIVSIVVLPQLALSLNNGLGRTPAMGYNTWDDFRCNITAQDIMSAADAIVRQGLNKVGYQYVNMDDCWAQGRYPNGTIYPDPTTFPNGIEPVANYVHSKGLKFGIYTDRGNQTCQGRPGSFGYEKIDADTYASWGVDYVKEDSCDATQNHLAAFQEYDRMRDALNSTGRPMYFSLCGWYSWYAPVGKNLGNQWRIAGDCSNWSDVLIEIDVNSQLTEYAGPGGWNDPDMLLGSTSGTAASLSEVQSRTMFSMWSVMAAPLLIGSNIGNLSQFDLTTYSNTEVIAVDQDPLGYQGIRAVGGNLSGNNASLTNIWAKLLSTNSWALVFLNNAQTPMAITCDSKCFQEIGIRPSDEVSIRDLWAHTNNGTTTGFQGYSPMVNGMGGSVMVTLTPVKNSFQINKYQMKN